MIPPVCRKLRVVAPRAFLIAASFWAACSEPSLGTGSTGAGGTSNQQPPPPPPKVRVVWPTPNPAFAQGRELASYVQPTVSGLVTSGLFGSVRSGGRQFHEGLDLLPVERDRSGEALDGVFAALAGVVRHVSAREGASSYGRYVVLEHLEESPPVYTLYAHLADIAPAVAPGASLSAGARVGRMGRSAGGYTIPKERAHLHFEIGLRMTDAFQTWYARRGFGSANTQGLYNGMNLMGVDPMDLFERDRAGSLAHLDQIFRELPAGLTLRIAHPAEPNFIKRYPSLRNDSSLGPAATASPNGGWEIDVSATGVPVRWRGIGPAELVGWKRNEVRILKVDTELLAANRGRDLVKKRRGADVPGDDLQTMLELVFDLK